MSNSISESQLAKAYDQFNKKGVTGPIFQSQLLESGCLSDISEAAVQGSIPDRTRFREFLGLSQIIYGPDILTVNFDETLEFMVTSGNYDLTNSDITPERFPIEGQGIVQYERRVFHFSRNITSEGAIRLIEIDDKDNPWEPAKIEHLLSSGKKNPDEQRQFPIVALSVVKVDGHRYVPFLYEDGALRDIHRSLSLRRFDYNWGSGYRFLAVRKFVS
ncbi:hypothetical protein EXS61_01230 [Candidatus Parcubacteria bacterium]|nr:hypothetical protein [Candidatus Parcubacteria bacterium]